MNYQHIIEETDTWVQNYIANQQLDNFFFHELAHTKDVVKAAQVMAAHYQLNPEDNFILTIAAYFHDLGYFHGGATDHERRSADIAREYLKNKQIEDSIIERVSNCILATRIPQQPTNLLEAILCDADLYHLGDVRFLERNKLMRKEWKALHGSNVSKEKWNTETLHLLNNHQFQTDYGKQFLQERKLHNITLLQRSIEEDKMTISAASNDNEGKKNKEKTRPDRGIETMFRVTSTNNQRLSDMADNKSNILITVNSIILSVVISLLLRKLDNNEHLTVPTLILLLVSLSTMVVAILATRPKVSSGTFTQSDVQDKKVNLLFFGNFYKMELQEYDQSMRQVMEDRDFLYGMLTKDIYSQGVVLGRKYKLLRLAYNIFMFGLIISVLSYLGVVLW